MYIHTYFFLYFKKILFENHFYNLDSLFSNMKFTAKLSAHLTPEWRQQYISYAVSVVLITIVL